MQHLPLEDKLNGSCIKSKLGWQLSSCCILHCFPCCSLRTSAPSTLQSSMDPLRASTESQRPSLRRRGALCVSRAAASGPVRQAGPRAARRTRAARPAVRLCSLPLWPPAGGGGARGGAARDMHHVRVEATKVRESRGEAATLTACCVACARAEVDGGFPAAASPLQTPCAPRSSRT